MIEIDWQLDPRNDDFYRGERAVVGDYELIVGRIPPACEEESVENVSYQVERLGIPIDFGSRTSFADAKAAAIVAYERAQRRAATAGGGRDDSPEAAYTGR